MVKGDWRTTARRLTGVKRIGASQKRRYNWRRRGSFGGRFNDRRGADGWASRPYQRPRGPNNEIGFVWLRSGPELRPSGVDKARRICRKRQRVCCGNTTASGALALQFGGSAARYLYDRHGALQYGGSTDGYRRDACSTRSGKLAGGTPAPLPGKNPPYTFLRNEPIWISRIFRWITFILRHL